MRYLFVRDNIDMFDMDYIISIQRPSETTIIIDSFGGKHYFQSTEEAHKIMCEKLLKYQLNKELQNDN